jgi:hypothetical protein
VMKKLTRKTTYRPIRVLYPSWVPGQWCAVGVQV